MESFENRKCPCVFVTVCDNPSVLNTLQFSHVKTGQTPEERVAVIKVSTHQGISHQDSSLISQVLRSNFIVSCFCWHANVQLNEFQS